MILKNKFPFISFRKKLTHVDYREAITLSVPEISRENLDLMQKCKGQLIDNSIPLGKIRFVFQKSFTYDVDNNIVNPQYKTMIPHNKKHPVIEIDKPKNLMTVFVGENRTHNNMEHLKRLVKKSKRGVVIMVSDDLEEMMWTASLDDAVMYYNEMSNAIDYNS